MKSIGNLIHIYVNLEDSSSDEETPDVRPKIQAMMSAYFEEVKQLPIRDIRGRKSYSVNFVQNEEKISSGMFTVEVVFQLHFTKLSLLFRKVREFLAHWLFSLKRFVPKYIWTVVESLLLFIVRIIFIMFVIN